VEFYGCRYLQGFWLQRLQNQLVVAQLRDVVLGCAALNGYLIAGPSAAMNCLLNRKQDEAHHFLLSKVVGTVFFFELTADDAHLQLMM
jgi:hypothetical protein